MDDTTTDTVDTDNAAADPSSTEVDPAAAGVDPNETAAEKALRQISEEEYEQYQRAAAFHDSLLEDLKGNPRQLLSRLMESNPELRNHMEELAAEDYLRQLEEAKLTPEQKKQRELEAELKRYKDAEEAAKKQSEEASIQAEQERLEGIMVEAMTKTGLPADPLLAEFARQGVMVAINAGIDFTPDDLALYIENKMDAIFGGRIDKLDGEALLNAIGPKALQKVKAALQAKAGKPKGTFTRPNQGGASVPSKTPPGGMYVRDRISSLLEDEDKVKARNAPKMTTEQRLKQLLRSKDE